MALSKGCLVLLMLFVACFVMSSAAIATEEDELAAQIQHLSSLLNEDGTFYKPKQSYGTIQGEEEDMDTDVDETDDNEKVRMRFPKFKMPSVANPVKPAPKPQVPRPVNAAPKKGSWGKRAGKVIGGGAASGAIGAAGQWAAEAPNPGPGEKAIICACCVGAMDPTCCFNCVKPKPSQ